MKNSPHDSLNCINNDIIVMKPLAHCQRFSFCVIGKCSYDTKTLRVDAHNVQSTIFFNEKPEDNDKFWPWYKRNTMPEMQS